MSGSQRPGSKGEATMIDKLKQKEQLYSQLNTFLDDVQGGAASADNVKVKLKDLDDSRAKNKGLTKKIEEIGKAKLREMEQVAQQNISLKKKIKGLDERIHDLSSSNDDLRTQAIKVNGLQDENVKLNQENGGLKTKAKQDAVLISKLTAENTAMRDQLSGKSQEHEESVEKAESLQRKLVAADEQVLSLTKALEELKTRTVGLKNGISAQKELAERRQRDGKEKHVMIQRDVDELKAKNHVQEEEMKNQQTLLALAHQLSSALAASIAPGNSNGDAMGMLRRVTQACHSGDGNGVAGVGEEEEEECPELLHELESQSPTSTPTPAEQSPQQWPDRQQHQQGSAASGSSSSSSGRSTRNRNSNSSSNSNSDSAVGFRPNSSLPSSVAVAAVGPVGAAIGVAVRHEAEDEPMDTHTTDTMDVADADSHAIHVPYVVDTTAAAAPVASHLPVAIPGLSDSAIRAINSNIVETIPGTSIGSPVRSSASMSVSTSIVTPLASPLAQKNLSSSSSNSNGNGNSRGRVSSRDKKRSKRKQTSKQQKANDVNKFPAVKVATPNSSGGGDRGQRKQKTLAASLSQPQPLSSRDASALTSKRSSSKERKGRRSRK